MKLNYKIGPTLSWAAMQQWYVELSVEICLGALGNVFNSTFCDHCAKIPDSPLGVTQYKQERNNLVFRCLRLTSKQANVEKRICRLSNYNYISHIILIINVVIYVHIY